MFKTVAVKINANGVCSSIYEVKYVDRQTYKELANQEQECQRVEIEKENELNATIDTLKQEIELLKEEIKVLKGEEE